MKNKKVKKEAISMEDAICEICDIIAFECGYNVSKKPVTIELIRQVLKRFERGLNGSNK